ncbi:MAG: hypothetical protein KatS3mg095_0077 [Candidatus Parcubacteria bacterium]|nr:MAG: hypothetical protein KatS3mg095_0077 [Candidatus Parcubacteria bacterium]
MEIIHSKTRNNFKDYENQANKLSQENNNIGGLGLFFLLIFAVIVDILGIISGIIDLGSLGIIGWILRILFSLIYLAYLFWFWFESNKLSDNLINRKTVHQEIEGLKNQIKTFINTARIIVGISIPAKWIPIIGAIIDALPIETFSVIFIFYILPNLISENE